MGMASISLNCPNFSTCYTSTVVSFLGFLSLPLRQLQPCARPSRVSGGVFSKRICTREASHLPRKGFDCMLRKDTHTVPRCSGSSSSNSSKDDNLAKTPFGYTRKDVLLIGLGVTVIGIALKSGLEFVGVDPLQAGNVVQLVLVLGLTVGWISTYIFRVSNKEMTYAQQLRDYENKVMQKRLESLTEAELEELLEQVEEEKSTLGSSEQVNLYK